MYRIVYIEDQGLGWMSPQQYDDIPAGFKGYVYTLAFCESAEIAKWIYQFLPKDWQSKIVPVRFFPDEQTQIAVI